MQTNARALWVKGLPAAVVVTMQSEATFSPSWGQEQLAMIRRSGRWDAMACHFPGQASRMQAPSGHVSILCILSASCPLASEYRVLKYGLV